MRIDGQHLQDAFEKIFLCKLKCAPPKNDHKVLYQKRWIREGIRSPERRIAPGLQIPLTREQSKTLFDELFNVVKTLRWSVLIRK